MIYQRESATGQTVVWTPKHTQAGETAMKEVVGEIGIKISNEKAAEVRERYRELTDGS